MQPTWQPAVPAFAVASEAVVSGALKRHLRPHDVLMHGVRFTDIEHGEVEIDLLVLMPDRGAVAIEVRGGAVSYSQGCWNQTDARGSHNIDPVRQARNNVYALRRYIERQPTWSRGHLRAAWMIALPDTHVTGDMGHEGRRDLLIGEQDLDDISRLVHDRLGRIDLQVPLPAAGWVEAVVGLLRGTANKPAEIAERTAARLQHVDHLSSAQTHILKAARKHRLLEISGSAGTGKTWLAIEQVRRWAEAGERVCFVSYTRGVIEMVQKIFADLPEKSQPAFIGTFHHLCHQWGVSPAPDAGWDFWEEEAVELAHAAAVCLAPEERFTAFVVDEAQDFADSWWPALLASAASSDFKLAVFKDDEQVVFSDRRGRPDLPMTELTLDDNLRSSQQIIDTFRPLISADVKAKAGPSYSVEYVDCHLTEVIDAADEVVADLLNRRGWLPEHVAFLTTAHPHPVHAELGGDKSRHWNELWATDEVFYSTVAGFNGLERPVVVLAIDGFHAGADPRSVLYTGMSRARELLIIVGPSAVLSHYLPEKTMRRIGRGH